MDDTLIALVSVVGLALLAGLWAVVQRWVAASRPADADCDTCAHPCHRFAPENEPVTIAGESS